MRSTFEKYTAGGKITGAPTLLIPLRYDPHAECPQFMAFLYRIMGRHIS